MDTLFGRISDWWNEQKAILEDRTEEAVIPPTDQGFDRVGAMIESTRQQVRQFLNPRHRGGQQ
jgi:hypothetical protein